eukprot:13294868-Alexandrium_andersonii.AAC.1
MLCALWHAELTTANAGARASSGSAGTRACTRAGRHGWPQAQRALTPPAPRVTPASAGRPRRRA